MSNLNKESKKQQRLEFIKAFSLAIIFLLIIWLVLGNDYSSLTGTAISQGTSGLIILLMLCLYLGIIYVIRKEKDWSL